MKNQFSLDISKPCAESWANFVNTTDGAFCASCSKNVIDFTKMNEEQIKRFFKNRPSDTCGRFRPTQLKIYTEESAPVASSGLKWLPAGFLGLLLTFEGGQGYAKNNEASHVESTQCREQDHKNDIAGEPGRTIKGTVVDGEVGEPIAGVVIYLKGDTIGVVSDLDGKFLFPKQLEPGEVLIFNFIGFETKEYVVSKSAEDTIEITLTLSPDLNIVFLGAVSVNSIYTSKPNPFKSALQKIAGLF